MPNGTRDFHAGTELEYGRFFEPLASQLQEFAQCHGLKLEKYYHEAPIWSFLFRHPQGGVAKIDVEKQLEDRCAIHQYWWKDDYDAGVRSLRQQQGQVLPRDAKDAKALLDAALEEILSWPPGSWTGTHGGFAEIWQRTWSRQAFAELEAAYPIATP